MIYMASTRNSISVSHAEIMRELKLNEQRYKIVKLYRLKETKRNYNIVIIDGYFVGDFNDEIRQEMDAVIDWLFILCYLFKFDLFSKKRMLFTIFFSLPLLLSFLTALMMFSYS